MCVFKLLFFFYLDKLIYEFEMRLKDKNKDSV